MLPSDAGEADAISGAARRAFVRQAHRAARTCRSSRSSRRRPSPTRRDRGREQKRREAARRKGFVVVHRELAIGDAPRAPKAIDDAPPGDRGEPGSERSRRIVGVAHRMHGKQNILHDVFDVAKVAAAAHRERAQAGRDRTQQPPIRFTISRLRARHQDRPVDVVLRERRNRAICRMGHARRRRVAWLRDEREVRRRRTGAVRHGEAGRERERRDDPLNLTPGRGEAIA